MRANVEVCKVRKGLREEEEEEEEAVRDGVREEKVSGCAERKKSITYVKRGKEDERKRASL